MENDSDYFGSDDYWIFVGPVHLHKIDKERNRSTTQR